jgi:hypothetical protein
MRGDMSALSCQQLSFKLNKSCPNSNCIVVCQHVDKKATAVLSLFSEMGPSLHDYS